MPLHRLLRWLLAAPPRPRDMRDVAAVRAIADECEEIAKHHF